MPPELPPGYYLDNVLTLFAHVSRVYADLLPQAQIDFLESFHSLDVDAQKLYIRLLNRSHDWYRARKLNYPEIGSMSAAIEQLSRRGLIEIDGEIEAPLLLSLFTKAELLSRLENRSGLDRLLRGELEAQLLAGDDDFIERLGHDEQLLCVLHRESYQICQMLFFGNLNQSMTDFVLRDLGLYQFESYRIDPANRPYRSQHDIQQHWLLYQLQTLFDLSDLDDPGSLLDMIAMIPDDIAEQSPGYRKSLRLRNAIARQLERLDALPQAYEIYRDCPLPPSRERRARILERQVRPEQAVELCREIITTPLDDEELQFACMFATRVSKRHALSPPPGIDKYRIDHQPQIVELELEQQASVELAVADYYNAAADSPCCYYVENSLFNGVLGLLIWDVVFAPIAGAFFNPFQHKPSDFYTHDFCRRRQDLLDGVWDSIKSNDDIRELISERWAQKQGVMNPLVNWQSLDLELIDLALQRIEFAHWRAIFVRILRDLRHNRAGFPDLVYFPPAGGYRLIEVKGPGDSLQKNQQRWMQYFLEHGIGHELARVTWRKS